MATLCIEGFGGFVASTAAPIATGWSDQVAGRDLHPLKIRAFSRRTKKYRLSFTRGGAGSDGGSSGVSLVLPQCLARHKESATRRRSWTFCRSSRLWRFRALAMSL